MWLWRLVAAVTSSNFEVRVSSASEFPGRSPYIDNTKLLCYTSKVHSFLDIGRKGEIQGFLGRSDDLGASSACAEGLDLVREPESPPNGQRVRAGCSSAHNRDWHLVNPPRASRRSPPNTSLNRVSALAITASASHRHNY